MCVAIPGKVIEIYDREALVEFGNVKKLINTDLIERVEIGQYVLVHIGCAIEKIDETQVEETLNLFHYLGGI